MLSKLQLLYKLSPAVLAALLAFTVYVAYVQYDYKVMAQDERDAVKQEYKDYKADNNAVKKIESNLIKEIRNGQKDTDNLRNSVDTGLVELRVKVESISTDSATASNIANRALRLAKSSQQDYYNLVNGIKYNESMILGWQRYYCEIIAPKNGTVSLCNNTDDK